MPPRLEWTIDLSVGVEVLDDHHRQIINLINRVAISMFTRSEVGVITSALHDLRNYTNFHFCEEEARLEALDYSDLEDHRRLHRHMIEQVGEMIEMHEVGSRKIIASELHEFLSLWLIRHIRNVDHAYAPLFTVGNDGADQAGDGGGTIAKTEKARKNDPV